MKLNKFAFLTIMSISTICCSSCGVRGELISLEVFQQPNKTVYQPGELFDTTGMIIYGNYYDEETDIATSARYNNYYYWCGDNDGKLREGESIVKITDKNDYNSAIFTNVTISVSKDNPDPTPPTPPTPGPYPDPIPQPDPTGYYKGISGEGESLREALHALNVKKRSRTVGYKPMLNNPSTGYYVTDPGNGKNTINTFYSGKSNSGTSGLNREHVWPNSRGGNLVDDDIHMTRPTLNAENGNRGNSFYVEGKCSSSSGWDPAATDFGKAEYRGDAARIIFYCSIAELSLRVIDATDDSTGNKTMGKLSDLLKWNLMYPVGQREITRNEGAESLQGNRNPFIDHPEYACKIWGTTNAATRQICGM